MAKLDGSPTAMVTPRLTGAPGMVTLRRWCCCGRAGLVLSVGTPKRHAPEVPDMRRGIACVAEQEMRLLIGVATALVQTSV